MRNSAALIHDEISRQVAASDCPVRAMIPEIERLHKTYDAISEAKSGTYRDTEESAVYDRLYALRELATHKAPTSIEGAALLLLIASGEVDTVLNGSDDWQKEKARRTLDRCHYNLKRFFESRADLSCLRAGFDWSMTNCDPEGLLESAFKKSGT